MWKKKNKNYEIYAKQPLHTNTTNVMLKCLYCVKPFCFALKKIETSEGMHYIYACLY